MSNPTGMVDAINQRFSWFAGEFRAAWDAVGLTAVDYRSSAAVRSSVATAYAAAIGGGVDVSALAALIGIPEGPTAQDTIDAAVVALTSVLSGMVDAGEAITSTWAPSTTVLEASDQLDDVVIPALVLASTGLAAVVVSIPSGDPVTDTLTQLQGAATGFVSTLQAQTNALASLTGGSTIEVSVGLVEDATDILQAQGAGLLLATGGAGGATVSAKIVDATTNAGAGASAAAGAIALLSADPADQIPTTVSDRCAILSAVADRLANVGGTLPAPYTGLRAVLGSWDGQTSITLAPWAAPYDPPAFAAATVEGFISFCDSLTVVP